MNDRWLNALSFRIRAISLPYHFLTISISADYYYGLNRRGKNTRRVQCRIKPQPIILPKLVFFSTFHCDALELWPISSYISPPIGNLLRCRRRALRRAMLARSTGQSFSLLLLVSVGYERRCGWLLCSAEHMRADMYIHMHVYIYLRFMHHSAL